MDRDRGHSPLAWTAMTTAALLLSLLLVGAVQLLYPRGPVTPPPPPRPRLMLVLLPPATVEGDTAVAPSRAPSPAPPPFSPPAALMRRLLLSQPVAPPVVAPRPAPPPPLLQLPRIDFLARPSPPDTSAALALWRLARWERGGRDSLRWLGLMMFHARRAGSFLANKRSIFGEDWLSAQPLEEPPVQRRR